MIKAMSYAFIAHEKVNQRLDGAPYSVHLTLCAFFALRFIEIVPVQLRNNVIDAVFLHDIIEDARKTYNDIKTEFGAGVADIVFACTNEKGRNRKERASAKYYQGIIETPGAIFVKLCDRLANVKYSKEMGSPQFEMYKKEHIYFISGLFPTGVMVGDFQPMVNELNQMTVQNGKL